MGGNGARSFTPRRGRNGSVWTGNLNPYTPETLKEALGEKGKPFGIADSVVKTNPHFNPGTSEFSENCQRCVVAYELRRRGYDVTALPTYKGDVLPRVAYHDSKRGTWEGRWKGAFKGAKTLNVGVRGNNSSAEQKVINNIEQKMKDFGSGSRGVVQIFYRGGGGHVFNVENVGGQIRYMEAQTGQAKNISQTMSRVDTSSVNLVRTDNLHISDRAKKFVTRKGRR